MQHVAHRGSDPASPPGRVIRQKVITRAEVQANPTTVYVFGDNMLGQGLGGQAGAMRGEPNAIGVPTKWRPDMRPTAFFKDEDWNEHKVRSAIRDAFDLIEAVLGRGHDVVIPAAGLGTGLAQLPTRAPRIHAYIEQRIAELEASCAAS